MHNISEKLLYYNKNYRLLVKHQDKEFTRPFYFRKHYSLQDRFTYRYQFDKHV